MKKNRKKWCQASYGSKLIDLQNAWNPNDCCFCWKRPCFGGLTVKNRGYGGSRWILANEVVVILALGDIFLIHFAWTEFREWTSCWVDMLPD